MKIYANKYLHSRPLPLLFMFVLAFFCICFSFDFKNDGKIGEGKAEGKEISYLSASFGKEEEASVDFEAIISDFFEILPDGIEIEEDGEGLLDATSARGIYTEIVEALSSQGKGAIGFFLYLLGASILIALVEFMPSERSDFIKVGAMAAAVGAIFARIYPVISEITDSLTLLTQFFSSLIPIISLLFSSGGMLNTAASGASSMSFTLWLYGGIGAPILLNLTLAIFSCSLASSFSSSFASVFRSVSGAFTKGITVLTTLLAGTVSVQSIIASSLDSSSLRATRYAVSNLIPVVGGALSGTMATIFGGLSYAGGIIGAGAVLVILSIITSPLVMLLLYKLSFFVVDTFLEYCGANEACGCIKAVSKGFDALIAVYFLTGVIYIFQTVVFLKGGLAI